MRNPAPIIPEYANMLVTVCCPDCELVFKRVQNVTRKQLAEGVRDYCPWCAPKHTISERDHALAKRNSDRA
ncbi:MAG TPA: hypothetical protein VFH61_10640 [Thermoleophilia bacterium]|nr:hypothetical protein [Thermoleophilia bacterium]